MNRRELIGTAGAALLWSRAAGAQRGGKIPEIGIVYAGDTAMMETRLAAFLEGLQSRGYFEGRNVALLRRSAESQAQRYEQMTKELVQRPVSLLVAIGPAAVRVAAAATKSIPIVALDLESDPVKSGFIQSVARPGGNLTGIFFDFPEFSAKWLQLLSEAVPGLERVAVIWDPATGPLQLEAISNETLARFQLLLVLKVATPAEIEPAFRLAGQQGANGLVILSSPVFGSNVKAMGELAASYRLPAITLFPEFARSGGLLAYGTSLNELYAQTGILTGRVLAGAKPAELPVERPSKFELVVNLRAAQALGLTMPTGLLLRANEVIE
jgi:putative tryptophan/tyrosine transport system substrate-binding protein